MKDTRLPEAIAKCLVKGYKQIDLAKIVMPELDPIRGKYYISRWKHGHTLSRVTKEHLCRICRIAEVDPNWIFSFKPKK